MSIEIIYEQQCGLGEGVYWHPLEHKLYWVDIKYDRIHRYDPKAKVFSQWQLPGLVSVVVATQQENTLLIGFEDKIATYNTADEALEILYDTKSGLRMNDGLVDPMGRFWIGQADDKAQDAAQLFRYDSDGSFHTMETGLHISNGLDWDLTRKRFYLADSPKGVIYVYDYDNAVGAISNRRELITFDASEGYPDGFILDTEGYIWCGMWDGHKILRISPEGRVVEQFDMPVQRPTKVAFGGDNLNTLYISTASSNRDSDEQLEQPDGYLLAMPVDVGGRLPVLFA